jgi:hypothetical protein
MNHKNYKQRDASHKRGADGNELSHRREKVKHNFSESKDISEDRCERQLKFAQKHTLYPPKSG